MTLIVMDEGNSRRDLNSGRPIMYKTFVVFSGLSAFTTGGNYGDNRVVNLIWQVKLESRMMALYLARSCLRCRDYLAFVIAEPKGRRKSQPVTDRCAFYGYKIHWTLLSGYGSIRSR